jgi:hypothetical protein
VSLCRAAELAVRDGDLKLAQTLATSAVNKAHTSIDTQGPPYLQVGCSMARGSYKKAAHELDLLTRPID